MKWRRRRSGTPEEPDPEDGTQQAFSELADGYHPRASVDASDRLYVAPAQVLENIALAMERVDLDIDTLVSIKEDVASAEEVLFLIKTLRMGPALAVHVVNTALRIMSARYPAELVGAPLPPQYDLRNVVPLTLTDEQQQTAKTIFNQRTASTADLTDDDIAGLLGGMDWEGQTQVFIALFYMYGTKVGALKYRTGIA
jgi:hypothetical protein